MTEKTLTTDNIRPALDALRGELAPWPVVTMKQDKLNGTQKAAINSGITSGLVAQIIANTAAIRALESAITGTGLRPLVVASLPAIGTQGILYIVPVTTYDPATDADVVNYSNEYIWIVAPDAPVTQGYYEQVGQTGIVINDGTLTVKANNVSLGTFTANQSGNTDINITIPTNSDYVDLTTDQTAAGVKTFSDGIVGNVTGTASRAIADADGNTISSTYGKLAGSQTWTGSNTFTGNTFLESAFVRNTAIIPGSTPSSAQTITQTYAANSNATLGYSRVVLYDTGVTTFEVATRNKFSNGALDPSGTYTESKMSVGLDNTGTGYFAITGKVKNSLTPFTNSTYTLGTSSYRWSSVYADSYYYGTTAFTDKFVTTDTSQTITGAKTFSSTITTKTNVDRTVAPSADTTYGTIICRDKNGSAMFRLQGTIKTDLSNVWDMMMVAPNASYITFFKYTISGSSSDRELRFKATSVIPDDNATADLGTSTNQWKSVYAQTYYYNGTQWGLDKANVWTGNNSFHNITPETNFSYSLGSSSKAWYGVYTSDTYLVSSTFEYGVAPSQDIRKNIYFTNGTQYPEKVGFNVNSNGATYINFNVTNKFTSGALDPNGTTKSTELQLGLRANGDRFIYTDATWRNGLTPYIETGSASSDSGLNLGTSTNKWKTLNGINPGALSLPDLNNTIDITSTFNSAIDKTQTVNSYSADFTGWLFINWWTEGLTNPFYVYVYCTNSATDNNLLNAVWGQSFSVSGNVDYMLTQFPVISGKTYWFVTNFSRASTDTKNLAYSVRKLPCLGNV